MQITPVGRLRAHRQTDQCITNIDINITAPPAAAPTDMPKLCFGIAYAL
jgi:hypothetical protein